MNKCCGDDLVKLSTSDASACVHLHGATLLSWTYKGKEYIFLSEQAVLDNKKAIRGGVPFVFPNFGPWSLGPQHGFARISRWTLKEAPHTLENGDTTAVFVLSDTEQTRALWNFRFQVSYRVTLRSNQLALDVEVVNLDENVFEFTLLLHTYLKTDDIKSCTISNLKGCSYIDKACPFLFSLFFLSVYKKTNEQHSCKLNGSTVNIIKKNFPDTVVWNPWEKGAKGMSDFGNDEYLKMVCVEAGAVSEPITLKSKGVFKASCTLEAAA
ncbi:unnamed protein product [Ixodes hexagonus]